MRSAFTALAVAALSASAFAAGCKQKQNDSPNPSGNAIILPGLQSQVPVGEPYDITWEPTKETDKVALVLLRGPADLAEEFLCIEESIPNSGTYSWTPPTSLENDSSRYGLKIIVIGTGEYQYSTQFGIRNDEETPEKSSSAKGGNAMTSTEHVKNTHQILSTTSMSASGTGKPSTTSYTVTSINTQKPSSDSAPSSSKNPAYVPSASPSQPKNSTTVLSSSLSATFTSRPSFVSSQANNRSTTFSEVRPTKPITKPSSLGAATSVVIETGPLPSDTPTATTSSEPVAQTTGAAARMCAGGLLAGVGAVAALVL